MLICNRQIFTTNTHTLNQQYSETNKWVPQCQKKKKTI